MNSASATTLTLNLSGIAKEVGVQFLSPVDSSRQTSIYLDSVTLQ
ncbi:hypothetical protein [Paenibacillus lautus]